MEADNNSGLSKEVIARAQKMADHDRHPRHIYNVSGEFFIRRIAEEAPHTAAGSLAQPLHTVHPVALDFIN